MSDAYLTSLTVANFRSLRGTVSVPLNAPVVLVHGLNGAGKTSLMTAISVALAGVDASVAPQDREFLIHRGSATASIDLGTRDRDMHVSLPAAAAADGAAVGLLDAATARFFLERSYLAQATLARLLDIYQHAVRGQESPLTRFVKELLHLDRLDAVIDGLSSVGDKRNFRKLVPEYEGAEVALTMWRRKRLQVESRIAAVTADLREARAATLDGVQQLSVSGPALDAGGDDALIELLTNGDEEEGVTFLIGVRRELLSAKSRFDELSRETEGRDVLLAEEAARDARQASEEWWQSHGRALEAVIEELRDVFPDLPSIAGSAPDAAYAAVFARITSELERVASLLTEDVRARDALAAADLRRERARARLQVIGDQVNATGIVSEPGGLSRVLAELLVHVQTDECPVCGREFAEVSPEPLVAHLAKRVAALTADANALQAAAKARLEAEADLRRADQERGAITPRLLAVTHRAALEERHARLNEAQQHLELLRGGVARGSALLRTAAASAAAVARARERHHSLAELRVVADDLLTQLRLPPGRVADELNLKIEFALTHVEASLGHLEELRGVRRRTREALCRARDLDSELSNLREEAATAARMVKGLQDGIRAADRRRDTAKALRKSALKARAEVTGTVFNESLNKVWRDLFVRLVPSEPFVPAFRVPDSASKLVTAQLETVHRDGGRAGAPRVMLSAGNLNTAALTLFLALHLSAPPTLPLLLLDDPVQSMDEVHIAQFAALLRTISKGQGRQVVVAVHERPLFEYLALELSPATQGDRLITIELTRTAHGDSVADPTILQFEQDGAVSAA